MPKVKFEDIYVFLAGYVCLTTNLIFIKPDSLSLLKFLADNCHFALISKTLHMHDNYA